MPQKEKTKQRLSDFVYDKIYENINNGLIKPGDWLSQEKIAAEYNVSQVTVREAFNRLIMNGLAERSPRKGVFVPVVTIEDLIDIYEIRIKAEGKAWAAAARNITREDLDRMRALLPYTGVNSETSSIDLVRRSNHEFHMIAIQASGRFTLIRILTQLLSMNNFRFLLTTETEKDRMADGIINIEEHTRLIEAMEKRDSELTGELITSHIQRSLKDRLELYKAYLNTGLDTI